MFKNMKIKVSLFLGFGITILVSVAIIIVMLIILNNQSNTYENIINSQVKANELILTCRIYTNNAARNVRDMALDPTDPGNADLQASAESALETLSEAMKELKDVYPLSDDKVEEYIAAMTEWYNELPDILDAINSGRQEHGRHRISSLVLLQQQAAAQGAGAMMAGGGSRTNALPN